MWPQRWRQLPWLVQQLGVYVRLRQQAGLSLGHWNLKWYHPQTRLGAIVSTDNGAAVIYNGAIDFCEGHCAPRVAHCDNREKGVGRQTGDDMGCLCTGWEIWQVKGAGVS
jgi:hypothetical protein